MNNDDTLFIHFDNEEYCLEFIKYAKNNQVNIGFTCCENKGCKILNKKDKIQEIKKNFLESYKKKIIPLTENTSCEDCCVCLTNTHFSTKCKHFLCKTCGDKISICPLCRQKL